MKKIWSSWLKEALFIYCTVYTVATLANSALYLASGIRNDPSGNWHELTRALIVLIGVVAYEMALHLPIKNTFVRALAVYVPTQLLAFLAVWSTKFIEPFGQKRLPRHLHQLYGAVRHRGDNFRHRVKIQGTEKIKL